MSMATFFKRESSKISNYKLYRNDNCVSKKRILREIASKNEE